MKAILVKKFFMENGTHLFKEIYFVGNIRNFKNM
jgi:hypothetical protein